MGLMTNYQKQHRHRLAASAKEDGGFTITAQMPSSKMARHQAFEKLGRELDGDVAKLKAIKSVKEKIKVKAETLVPKYLPAVKSLTASNSADPLLGQILVWLFDINDIPEAMDLAVYCIEHEVPMPERFKRDLHDYLCDTIVDWAEAEHEAGRSTEPYFGQVCSLAVDWDIPDQVRAKISRLQGLIAMDKENFEAAVTALETALEYGAKVKTALAQAKKKLEAGTEE